jgi:DNA (cytosine-5)-methyltransferase 1
VAKHCSTDQPIRIVDLFAGAGGMALGWQNASPVRGTEVLAAVDADPTLRDVYEWNSPTVRFVQHSYGDPLAGSEVRAVGCAAGLSEGSIDVLVAGPPCQSFSAAGKRERHPDHRLVFHVCDFAEAFKPKVVVIENVPEFSRAEDGRLLGRVRVRFAEAGYMTHVAHLTAVAAGVPQLRTRCFTIAVRKDIEWPGTDYFGRCFDNPSLLRRGAELPNQSQSVPFADAVKEAIDDLPSLAAGEGNEISEFVSEPRSAYQTRLRDVTGILYNHIAARHSPDLVAMMAMLKAGETPQQIMDHPLRRKAYFRGAYARLDPELPAPTMTTQTHNPGSGRFTHYRDHRVLTVREVARIQSFPDRFRFFGSQAIQRRHVGNAVPPMVSQFIASILLPLID